MKSHPDQKREDPFYRLGNVEMGLTRPRPGYVESYEPVQVAFVAYLLEVLEPA